MGVARSESEWEQLLSERSVSGVTIKALCRARGINKSSFYKQRINKGADNEGDGKEFVELLPKSTTRSYGEIVNGVTVKIPSTECATRIADLVRALKC
jgi:hypothetical protein